MFIISGTLLGVLILGLLLWSVYFYLLPLEKRYRIVEMGNGDFVTQKRNLFNWKPESYHYESHYSSLAAAQRRIIDIINSINKDNKSREVVKIYTLSGGGQQIDKLLLKDLISKLSLAVNTNNKEEEEDIFNKIEKILK